MPFFSYQFCYQPCSFMRDVVIPRFVGDDVMEDDICGGVGCTLCSQMFAMFAFWLDEEYIEPRPEVDWSKVPVDTLVRVRDYEDEPWKFMYFHGYNPQNYHKFEVWKHGATSKTTGNYELWMFCELVEDEDDSK